MKQLFYTFKAYPLSQNSEQELRFGNRRKGGGVQGVVKEDLMPIPHQQKIHGREDYILGGAPLLTY